LVEFEVKMTEQGRGEETPIQFPRVPKRYIDGTLSEISGFWNDSPDTVNTVDYLGEFFMSEPFLAAYIVALSLAQPDLESAQEVVLGAFSMHRILKKLENQGFDLSSVSKDTIDSQRAEFQLFNMGFSESLNISEINREIVQENPELSKWLKSLPKIMGSTGYIVYRLKRRQFHADQLAKQFGG